MNSASASFIEPVARRRDLQFAILTAVALLITHAVAFMLHEYSHATLAWLLGFKDNPLALHYGHFDLSNLLLQQDIDENVDYGPIFATGHDFDAAMIALAGPGFGNGVLYIVCALVLRRQVSRMRPAGVLFVFWLSLMACGNLWSYAPIRTIATHADMALLARGLGISDWTLFPFVVIPSLWAAWDFFVRVLPMVLNRICGDDVLRRVFITAVACFIFFGFYGVPALVGNYGNISAVFSILSLFVLFPVVLMMTLSPAGLGTIAPRSAR
jgi:hypothetical protein